jgi:hypothetical protein
MSFPFADVDKAIRGIRSELGCAANEPLQEQFDAGLHPNLLSYQKGHKGTPSIPVLDRYLVGATSYLHQPSTYYDIFGAGRCVILVHLLHSALRTLRASKTKGLTQRTEKLTAAVDLDVFDSTAFEVITAARYARLPVVDTVEFIDENPPKKTPDFMVSCVGFESLVECKKASRVRDYGVTTRSTVRALLNGVISRFRERGVAFEAEVVFHCEPKRVIPASLSEACQASLDDRTAIVTSQFTVTVTRLPKYDNKDFILYPSPAFSWSRYHYRIRGEWFGIVHQLVGKPARIATTPTHLQGGQSTWIDKVEWDSAIKWRISAEDVVAKYRRFPFDNLFDAINQIGGAGLNSTVHLWLETDYFIGGRRDALLDFFRRLSNRAHKAVGWILVNETLIDVSPKGRFDLIEHAHMIRGPTATTPKPLVAGIFGRPSPRRNLGEFGVGHELSDIDED